MEATLGQEEATKKKSKEKTWKILTRLLSLVPIVTALLKLTIFRFIQMLCNNFIQVIIPAAGDDRTMTQLESIYLTTVLLLIVPLTTTFAVVRYRQIDYIYNNFDFGLEEKLKKKIFRWNKLLFFCVMVMAVAEFFLGVTWAWDQLSVIIFGTIYFFAGYLAGIVQTKLSFITVPHLNTRRVAIFRLSLIVAVLICSIGSQEIATIIFFLMPPKYQSQVLTDGKLRWTSKHDDYYLYHFMYAMNALMWFIGLVFIASFYFDFKMCKIVDGKMTFKPRKEALPPIDLTIDLNTMPLQDYGYTPVDFANHRNSMHVRNYNYIPYDQNSIQSEYSDYTPVNNANNNSNQLPNSGYVQFNDNLNQRNLAINNQNSKQSPSSGYSPVNNNSTHLQNSSVNNNSTAQLKSSGYTPINRFLHQLD